MEENEFFVCMYSHFMCVAGWIFKNECPEFSLICFIILMLFNKLMEDDWHVISIWNFVLSHDRSSQTRESRVSNRIEQLVHLLSLQ